MKKIVVVAVILAVVALSAHGLRGLTGSGTGARQVDVNAFRQFQKETLPLRDEMMAKRLELQKRVYQGEA